MRYLGLHTVAWIYAQSSRRHPKKEREKAETKVQQAKNGFEQKTRCFNRHACPQVEKTSSDEKADARRGSKEDAKKREAKLPKHLCDETVTCHADG